MRVPSHKATASGSGDPTPYPCHLTLTKVRTAAAGSLAAAGLLLSLGDTPLVRDASLALHRGEIVALVGPNGAGWQRIVGPVNRRCAGGCHLNRRIDGLVTAAGFEMVRLEAEYLELPAPKSQRFGFVGVGRKV